MKNWQVAFFALLLSVFTPQAFAQQSFCAVWPLTSDQSGTVSPAVVATSPNEILSAGSNPALQIFDYWSGQGQRLKSAGIGSAWTAGPVNISRYLQFNVKAAVGYQLTITNVAFDYGGNGSSSQITSDVRYTTDTVNYPPFALGIPNYPVQSWTTFSQAVPNATITGGTSSNDTFSLRIMPYAITGQQAGAPSFAAHRNVKICGTATSVATSTYSDLALTKSCVINGPQSVLCTLTVTNNGTAPSVPPLHIADTVTTVPSDATYTGAGGSLPISCSPGAGPVTPISCNANTSIQPGIANQQTALFSFHLPTGGTMTNCATVTTPQTDPTPANNTNICSTVTVPSTSTTLVSLPITKSTGLVTVAGTYTFNVSCVGPAAGQYTGPNPVSITLPGTGTTSIQVPQGDACTLTENQPSSNLYNSAPLWGGSSDVQSNGWSATVGPVSPGDSVTVKNMPSFRWTTLSITKSTGAAVIAGTYTFNLSCSDTNGDTYTPAPVIITLPGTSTGTAQVPYQFNCNATETASGSNWDTPVWSGTGVTGNGWGATIGPYITSSVAITATNRQKTVQQAKLQITKSTGAVAIAGTYTFNVSCTGSGGPYTGPNPISVTLPGSGVAGTTVPQGDTCILTETQPTSGSWNAPTWSGTGVTGNGWSGQLPISASSNAVTVTNNPVAPKLARLILHKSTGATVIAGTYLFNITCTGSGGPYTGTNPISITLPGTGSSTALVPQGDSCTVTEMQPTSGSWDLPSWAGNGITPTPISGWSTQTGLISSGGTLTATNNPKKIEMVKLQITKSTGDTVVAGTYLFNIACTGTGGPYTGTNPISITLPGSGVAGATVPQGDTCTVTETQPAGPWNTPTWSGTSVTGSGWGAQVAITSSSNAVKATNHLRTALLQVEKRFSVSPVAGTYTFTVSCTGSLPYTGTLPITVPSTGIWGWYVPQGDSCTIQEQQPAGFGTPTWSGVTSSSGWSAQVGPVNINTLVSATNNPKKQEMIKFPISKSTGDKVIAGTYTFNLSCNGTSGPYTPAPVTITLPGAGTATAVVPQGDTCTITEVQPSVTGWGLPSWSGSGITPSPASGWTTSAGPINPGSTLNALNHKTTPKLVPLSIGKSFPTNVVPGTYSVSIICSGPGGPYTGLNPIQITTPSPGFAITQVPLGDTCMLTESQSSIWSTPSWAGSGITPSPAIGWTTQIGPINATSSVKLTNNPKKAEQVKLQITKSTGDKVIAGTYSFNIACAGSGGPYTGPNPVSITLPGSGTTTVPVPQGDTCTVTESQPVGSWNAPTWSGIGVTGIGWSAQVPINSNTPSVKATNSQKKTQLVDLTINKSTGDTVIPGTYYFLIACTGTGGPFSIGYPVQIVLPGTGTYVAHVPAGDTCTVTEGQLDQATWNTPTWSGNGVSSTPNPWAAQVGPLLSASSVKVTNHKNKKR